MRSCTGSLSPYWGGTPRAPDRPGQELWTGNGLWLGPWAEALIGVGMLGDYPALAPIVSIYGPDAERIYYPYPREISQPAAGDRGQLLMLFSRDGLRRAAQRVWYTAPQ